MGQNRTLRLPALIVAVTIILIIPAVVLAAPHPQNVPLGQDTPTQPPNPQAGLESYAQNCAPCHGETGGGDGPSASGLNFPPAALGDYEAVKDLSPADWFEVTRNGRIERMMPPWSNRLTDQEIWDTVAYAWTLHTSPAQVKMGQAVYEQNCATCHGPDGKGSGAPGMLDFTDFAATSQVSQQAWAQVVAEGRDKMPAFGDKLSEAERAAALEYVRSLSLGPSTRAPLAPGQGVITGTVTNETTGAPVAGLPITLGVFDGASLLEERSAATDASGGYRFEGLSTDPAAVYIARAEYPAGGLPYSSEMVGFAGSQTAASLPLSVYETTTDPSGIRADRVHYIVDLEPGRLLIAELVVLSQDGDRAYIGDGSGVLKFTLPAGAEDLSIEDGELGEDQRYARTADGFVDRLPMPPGEQVRQVLYRYALPYEGTALDLSRALAYPSANVNVLATDQGQKVTSADMADQGRRTTEQGSFFSFTAQDVPAGKPLAVRMTNLPRAGAAAASQASGDGGLNRGLLIALVAAVAAVAALLAALPLLRRSNASGAAVAVEDRDDLADALARLTLAYENGEISESAYRDRRLRYKAQMLDAEARAGARRPG